MKINRLTESIIVLLIYLSCLYIWTLPLQNSPLPYGEVDASSHYAVADYSASSDRAIGVLPVYIDKRYGKDNVFKDGVLWYPPPYHLALAGVAIFGGESSVPIFFANAIFCSLIVLSVYFIMRKLFGIEVAIGSSILLIFSLRDILIYLWGQWPERMAFAYVPLILYSFYKYFTAQNKNGQIYLYITLLLLAANLFIHPMVFFHSVAALGVFGVLLIIKYRKLPFNWKHIILPTLLFLLLISLFPLQVGNVLFRTGGDEGPKAGQGDFSRLFYWFKAPTEDKGVPVSYFSYKAMVGPLWTILLIIAGILFLLIRRNDKDLLMLAWLFGLYLIIHMDFFGLGRVHRSLSGSAHIFYPLIFIGLMALISFVPLKNTYKKNAKFIGLVIMLFIVISSFGINSFNTLKSSYQGIQRINEFQFEFTQWLKEVDDDHAVVSHIGSISLAKTRWLWMIGQKLMVNSNFENYNISYVLLDYSDFALAGDVNTAGQIQAMEGTLTNYSMAYSNNYMKVYKVEN